MRPLEIPHPNPGGVRGTPNSPAQPHPLGWPVAVAPYKPGVNVLAAPGELSGGDDSSGRTQISAAIQRHPRLCALLTQPQVEGLIGGVIGEDFNYTGGDGNFYTGNTGWHPDGNWGELFAIKLAVYLDGERSQCRPTSLSF